MTNIRTAIYLSTLTEIKNVIINLNLNVIESNNCYWEIKDQLLNDFEDAQNMVTQLKVNRYDKMKLKNKKNVYNYLQQMKVNDYYDDLLIQCKIDDVNIKDSIVNTAYKNQNENKEIETILKKVYEEKHIYQEKAVEFLQTFDFFYYDKKHLLTPDIIMDSLLYQSYLKKLYGEIQQLSNFVVNHRIKSESYTKITKFHSISYVITNNNEIKNKQQLLGHLVRHLYTLLKTIKNTYMFLNAIITSFVTNEQLNSFNIMFNKLLIEQRKSKHENKELLPNSWSDYFKKMFISERANNVKELMIVGSVKDYLRYMSFWFEKNNFQNNYDKFVYKLVSDGPEEVDYVALLFGPSLIDTHVPDQFMNVLYTTPFMKETKQDQDQEQAEKFETELVPLLMSIPETKKNV